jgi:hypothetical protein
MGDRNYVLRLWMVDYFRRRTTGFDSLLVVSGYLVFGSETVVVDPDICDVVVRKFPSRRFVVLLLMCCVCYLILVWASPEIAWRLRIVG